MTPDGQTAIDFLYTNIGRGHPHYLDGIVETLSKERVGNVTDVFSVSRGSAHAAWKLIQTIYRVGGRGGLISKVYSSARARNDYNRRGLTLSLLGRDVTRTFVDSASPLVVAHPLLVAQLRNKQNLFYQHGELVAPNESFVGGDHRIIVPLDKTADRFVNAGLSEKQIFVSGLCIEPALVHQAESAMRARVDRMAKSSPLSGAFFSSGAEPGAHIHSIVSAAVSVVDSGGRALIFARHSGALQKHARERFTGSRCELVEATKLSECESERASALLCLYHDRRQLNELTARLFPLFDYFVAPAHERTNWALGLGLPMFVVCPPMGSYAPLNRDIVLESGVAKDLGVHQEALHFGKEVGQLQLAGELNTMAESGWGRYTISGFSKIAEMLEAL